MPRKIELYNETFGEFRKYEPSTYEQVKEYMNKNDFKVPSKVTYKNVEMEINENKVIAVFANDHYTSKPFEFIWEAI